MQELNEDVKSQIPEDKFLHIFTSLLKTKITTTISVLIFASLISRVHKNLLSKN